MILSPRQVYELRVCRSPNQVRLAVTELSVIFIEFSNFCRTYKSEIFRPPEHHHPLTGVADLLGGRRGRQVDPAGDALTQARSPLPHPEREIDALDVVHRQPGTTAAIDAAIDAARGAEALIVDLEDAGIQVDGQVRPYLPGIWFPVRILDEHIIPDPIVICVILFFNLDTGIAHHDNLKAKFF